MDYWLLLRPDLERPIGGVKQMHRLAEALVCCGRSATLIQDDEAFRPKWFQSTVNTISFSSWKTRFSGTTFHKDHTLVIPETYLPKLYQYAQFMNVVIFNQNGSYTFGLPSSQHFKADSVLNAYASQSLAHLMCVSSYDYKFLTGSLGLSPEKVSLIVNSVEDVAPSVAPKRRQIVYMPRKNRLDSNVVSALLARQPWFRGWELIPLDNLSHVEVMKSFCESLLFLSFGHPEGFGLPVAEAMASGCAVAGYSGLGGRELFALGKKFEMAEEVAFGDWQGFIDTTKDFIKSYDHSPGVVLSRLDALSAAARSIYSFPKMVSSVKNALASIENC